MNFLKRGSNKGWTPRFFLLCNIFGATSKQHHPLPMQPTPRLGFSLYIYIHYTYTWRFYCLSLSLTLLLQHSESHPASKTTTNSNPNLHSIRLTVSISLLFPYKSHTQKIHTVFCIWYTWHMRCRLSFSWKNPWWNSCESMEKGIWDSES